MAYSLTETYKIQMYAGDKPQELTRIITVNCWYDYQIIMNYKDKFVALMNELEENKVKIWELNSGKELEEERQRRRQLEKDRDQLFADLTDRNKDIATILTKWKVKDLVELSAGIQNIINERNELTKEVKNKDNIISNRDKDIEKLTELSQDLKTKLTEAQNIISQRDKSIHNLELKNEKLTDSYKKVVQYLADARQLVSHLQKDLQTEKQDKVHIQKELDDALAILNKPTTEMGTQTDLTAEQITQMEKDIEKYRDLLYQGAMEIDKIEKELTTLRSEIKTLQKQVKDKETNKAEKELLDYVKRGISTPLSGTILPNELLEKLQDENKWTSLRFEYEIVRQKLITLTKRELERRDLATKITKLEKEKGELQTKYDMEVKSKKEVVEELDIARKYFCLVFKENFYQREISEIDKKRIRKFCSNSYNKVIVFSLNKEENDFSFFNFAPKNFFIDCRKAPSSFKLKTIERIGEKKTFKITTDYLFGENYIFGWDKVSVKEISREKMTRPEYWDADKYFDVVEYEIKKE